MAHNVFHNCTIGGNVNGANNLFDKNVITGIAAYAYLINHGDIDVMRAFGINNTVRNNYVHDLYKEYVGSSHVDFVQNYDNNREITHNLLVEGNFVDCFMHQGFMLQSDSYPGEYLVSGVTIRNNVIKGYTAWGMCAGNLKDVVVENNIFIGADGGGIYGLFMRGKLAQGSIRNNILVNLRAQYGAMEGAVITDSGNNLIYQPTRAWNSETEMNADPLFVDAENGDYRLKAGSPAIDAGRITEDMREPLNEDGTIKIRWDADGKNRISGDGIDIGPYEYQANASSGGIESLLLDEGKVSLGIGDKKQIGMHVYPKYANNQALVYETSDTSVVTVNASGELTGIGEGTATITVKNVASKVTACCQVTVQDLPGFRSLGIDPEVLTFEQGINTYAVDVPYETASVSLTPEWVNGQVTINGAIVPSSGASVNVPLAVGDNAIVVTYTPNTGVAVSYLVNLKRSGICYYNAKEGFSDTQGKNQWYYYRNVNGELIELTWSEIKGMWTMHDSLYRPWIQSDRQHSQDGLGGSVRGFKSPMDGTVAISGDAIIGGRKPYTNGSILSIRINDEVLWTEHIYEGHEQFSPYILVDVKAGDMIYFTEDFYGKQESHNILWNPTIALSMAEGYEVALPGDINVDGKVDEGDLATIATNLSKTSADTDWTALKSCDRNTDGKLDILDLVMVGKLVKTQ